MVQDAAPCRYTVTSPTILPATGGEITVAIETLTAALDRGNPGIVDYAAALRAARFTVLTLAVAPTAHGGAQRHRAVGPHSVTIQQPRRPSPDPTPYPHPRRCPNPRHPRPGTRAPGTHAPCADPLRLQHVANQHQCRLGRVDRDDPDDGRIGVRVERHRELELGDDHFGRFRHRQRLDRLPGGGKRRRGANRHHHRRRQGVHNRSSGGAAALVHVLHFSDDGERRRDRASGSIVVTAWRKLCLDCDDQRTRITITAGQSGNRQRPGPFTVAVKPPRRSAPRRLQWPGRHLRWHSRRPPPPPPPCTYPLPTGQDVADAGASGSVAVTASSTTCVDRPADANW